MKHLAAGFSWLPVAVISLAVVVLVTAGCSGKNSPSESAQVVANDVAVRQQFNSYKQMLALHRPELAVAVGEGIISKYPGTPEAAEVEKALPGLKAEAEKARLAGLWLYQGVKTTGLSGGLQYTAIIESSQPTGANQVQLILRRHEGWPEAVYLYGSGHGFVCKDTCDVVMRIDGKREVWKAYLPDTGEPAMLFKNEKAFIVTLSKSKAIEMDVTTKDHGPETLTYEVGGFDPAQFKQLPKK